MFRPKQWLIPIIPGRLNQGDYYRLKVDLGYIMISTLGYSVKLSPKKIIIITINKYK